MKYENENDKSTNLMISDIMPYTQSPIIKNGPIKNDAEILEKLRNERWAGQN